MTLGIDDRPLEQPLLLESLLNRPVARAQPPARHLTLKRFSRLGMEHPVRQEEVAQPSRIALLDLGDLDQAPEVSRAECGLGLLIGPATRFECGQWRR